MDKVVLEELARVVVMIRVIKVGILDKEETIY